MDPLTVMRLHLVRPATKNHFNPSLSCVNKQHKQTTSFLPLLYINNNKNNHFLSHNNNNNNTTIYIHIYFYLSKKKIIFPTLNN